ncbi:protein GLUTAMINE DUMPER 1 [Nicotiana tabacum]|uniref:Protein GLUTAMINE DUMPER 1 n=1 Tax=Nicotiana tabacum TaxID=4097 RepID=A0A1S4DN91_TOBAC|nr:protein GLUTAMINE DUMPER 2-like [Nicotiana tomentosiformis]XP_016514624.1 PREDICTED: protein GLUTAMINE DUMPER 2-like [Nicotiana tabacum]
MRTGSGFSTTSSPTIKATFSPPAIVQRSPWHSPVPYLFGGLAAMLGLIAFALLILACSYWKLSSHLREHDDNQSQDDTEAGAGEKPATGAVKAMPEFEEKIVVIMAGDLNPSFLATPMLMLSKVGTVLGDGSNLNKCEENLEKGSDEKEKLEQVVIEIREESNGDSQHSHGQNQ